MSPQSSQAALAALNGVRPVLAHFDTPRSAEDLAADILAATKPDNRKGLTPEFEVRSALQADEEALPHAARLQRSTALAARSRATRSASRTSATS